MWGAVRVKHLAWLRIGSGRGPGKGHLAGGSIADDVGSMAVRELVELLSGRVKIS